MKKLKAGDGLAIFVLFFGIALVESFLTANLLMILFWVSIGLLFLVLDSRARR